MHIKTCWNASIRDVLRAIRSESRQALQLHAVRVAGSGRQVAA